MASITVNDEAHWRALRGAHVGASESAALLGCHPRMTRWQLWHIKQGTLDVQDYADNEMVQAGRFIEPALAAWAADKFGMQLRKVRRYIEHDGVPMMGASLDYESFGEGKLIPVEFKFSLFGSGWEWDGDDLLDYPLEYGVQVQHQMAVTGAEYGVLIAFTGGALRRAVIPRMARTIAMLEDAVTEFAVSLAEKREPDPDWEADAEAVVAVHSRLGLANLNLSGVEAVERLCVEYERAAAAERTAEAQKNAARAELITRLSSAAAEVGREAPEAKTVATCGPWKITASWIGAKMETLTQEKWEAMKETIGVPRETRRGYRRVTITNKDAKKENENGGKD